MIKPGLFFNFQNKILSGSRLVNFLLAVRNRAIFRSASCFRQSPIHSAVVTHSTINRLICCRVLERSRAFISALELTEEAPALVTMAEQKKKPFERLPKDVVPSKYCIRLHPNLKTFTFEGSEDIVVEVKSRVSSITLNCADIVVKEAAFCADGGGDSTLNAEISYAPEDETVKFTFPSALQAGKGTLKISFTGELNDKMKGFYRSVYKGPDGEDRVSAVTQFEATDARRAFPCWDEPSVKAVFDVTLVVPKELVALSNMPVKKESVLEGDPSQKVVVYESTPIMSTYLVAFVVGDYDYVEKQDTDGVLVRVYTPAGKKEQGQFALEVAVKTLPFYKNYFGIAYPLPKMDLIAIADFAAGAMENWGLVTYRETALLVDPQNTSSRVKQWVALVVGHELAHQWFGNLVTMEWWTHLWLNEGFASWIEYLCVDHCFPEYDIWTQFVNNDLSRALELDALHNSHPIEVPVGHPSEVDEIFDAISYSKGASVIRMLHSYIGDADFRKGMNHYLTTHQYKNAFTEDLWASLEKASGKPVAAVMTTWTKQMGFPVLKVTEKQDGDKRELTISQEKFCADGKLPEGDKSVWMVPVSIITSKSPDKPVATVLLDKPSMTVTLDNVQPGDWVKLNAGTVGVYRVVYPPEMLAALVPAIKSKALPSRDRLGLQNDLFALARAGLMPTVEVLKVVQAYNGETDFTVWTDLNSNLSVVALLMQYTDKYPQFQAFCCTLFGDMARKLGWDRKEGEGHLDSMLRELMIARMGRYGDPDFLAEARKRFEAHVSGASELPADLRAAVYGTVLTHGDEATYEKMLKLYDAADMQEEKVRISRALGSVLDEALIQKVLDFALSEKVRSQDTVFVIAGTTGSVAGREKAWRFTQENWAMLHSRYKGGFLLARLVKSTTENFAAEDKAQAVDKFFKEHPAPAAERTVQQSIENIHLNARFLAQEAGEVGSFLATQ